MCKGKREVEAETRVVTRIETGTVIGIENVIGTVTGAKVETVIGIETERGIGITIDIEGVTETENDEKDGLVKAERSAGGVEVNQKNARKVDPQKEREDQEVTAKAP